MGLRFQRRVNFGPFRLNFSRSGVGMSVGVPGFRVGVRPNGRKYSRVSLPGTGVGYQHEFPASNRPSRSGAQSPPQGAGCALVILTVGAGVGTVLFI
jgi:hypothetical protein